MLNKTGRLVLNKAVWNHAWGEFVFGFLHNTDCLKDPYFLCIFQIESIKIKRFLDRI